MKFLAFALGLCVAVIGVVALVMPSALLGIAEQIGTSSAFYIIGAIRVVAGLLLISAASASRAPRALRILGIVVLIAGVATALIGLLGMDRARAAIDWWLKQGPVVIRAAGVLLIAIGGFIAYACSPAQRRA
jgi:hypothetical protein